MKTIQVKGMSCGHCKASVEKAMASVPGVADVRVDLEPDAAGVPCRARRARCLSYAS